MYWMPSADEITPDQLAITEEALDPIHSFYWVKGCAGSGKTVVLMLALEKYLAQHPSASVCFLGYTNSLVELAKNGIPSRMAGRIETMTHTAFKSQHHIYDLVALDEVQDIPMADLQNICSKARKLIVAGDFNQRIFSNGASEGELHSLFSRQPNSEGMLANSIRLTKKLLHLGAVVLEDYDVWNKESEKSFLKRGSDIYIKGFDDAREEVATIWNHAKEKSTAEQPSVILLPTHKLIAEFSRLLGYELGISPPKRNFRDKFDRGEYADYNEFWASQDIPLMYLGGKNGSLKESDSKPMVYIMTYHSAKGLDFSNVYLPFLNEDQEIANRNALKGDELLENKLLYVGVTRSRYDLFITYHSDRPHPLIQEGQKAGLFCEFDPDGASQNEDEEDSYGFF